MRYHRDVYWPAKFPKTLVLNMPVVLTQHALIRARSKDVQLDFTARWEIIEIDDGASHEVKVTLRAPQGNHLDSVIVVALSRAGARIVTCWVNRSDDTHKTLDVSAYAQSPSARVNLPTTALGA